MIERQRPYDAVIIDDEPAARDVVRTLLGEHPSIRVVAEAGNGRDAIAVIRHARPDLVFLDVQMPDLDGFGVLEQLGEEVPRGLIFVTAHDEHALRAFEVHALDYILKPFGRPRFRVAIERAVRRLEGDEAMVLRRTLAAVLQGRSATLSSVIDGMHDRDSGVRRPERIGVRQNGRTVMVDVPDIDWIEADRDYARLHTSDRAFLIAQRMNSLEEQLDPGRFLRIHRSTIVNLLSIRELRRAEDGGGEVVLESGVRLRVARNRWSDLERVLRLRTAAG
jgi:two-component system, LytTR family, response regulator